MRKRITWTEYIIERAIATVIIVNSQRIMLMSVYFPHSGYADHHIEKMYRTIEKHTKSWKNIQIIGRDFNAELGLGTDVEPVSVGPYTLKESNKRGDWLKQWMQNQVALGTMYRKMPEKQNTYRTPKGTEKQLDYILIKRRHMGCIT